MTLFTERQFYSLNDYTSPLKFLVINIIIMIIMIIIISTASYHALSIVFKKIQQ